MCLKHAHSVNIIKTGTCVCPAISAFLAWQVGNGGGGQGLLVDTLGRVINPSYKQRVALHEAGHMLIAYIVGILPRDFTLSSWDAFVR